MKVFTNDDATSKSFLLPFVSETFSENINPIISEAINSSRAVLSARGGNIRSDGGATLEVTTESEALNHLFAHLLGKGGGAGFDAYPATAPFPNVIAIVAAVSLVRGTYYSVNGGRYLCVKPTTTALSLGDITDFVSLQEGDGDLPCGTGLLQYYGAMAVIPKRMVVRGAKHLPVKPLEFFKTFEVANEDINIKFEGVKVNSVEISVPQEGIVTANFAALGSVSSPINGSNVPTADADNYGDGYTGYECVVLSETVTGAVQTATISISNELDGDVWKLGSRYRHDIVAQRRSNSGNVVLYLENLDAYNAFKDETTFELKFFFAYKGRYLEIDFPAAKFLGGSPTPQIGGNGVITVPVDFQTMMDATKGYDVQISRVI